MGRTTAGTPGAYTDHPARTRTRGTWPPTHRAPPSLRFCSLFRVISADVYLDHFASDRSHMVVSNTVETSPQMQLPMTDGYTNDVGTEGAVDGAGASIGPQYSMPPPPYPPLCGAKAKAMGVVNNLMASFVSMAIKPASQQPAAEDIPHPHPASLVVGSDGEFAAPVDAGAGPRSATAGEYGQVMDMGGFVRWMAMSGTDSDSLGC
ncbi:hypothetical protein C8Q80DRAFT_1168047 [Daedaleopsis nitida]|nr:hypothetical protein C8Q80DRAFT_1168047 [Daedaleopsis nitida]